MTSKTSNLIAATAVVILGLLAPKLALAQATNFNDDFTGKSDNNGWVPYDGACLTAGDGTGTIPACVGSSYYTTSQAWVGGYNGTLPDPAGNGALRLTNGCTGTGCSNGSFNFGYHQAGGIISPTFNAAQGVQITFKTFTYEGNSGGNGQSGTANGHMGADGISFFILDGTITPPNGGLAQGIAPYNSNTQFDVGAFGGSLGYTCTDALGNDDPNFHPGGVLQREFDGVYGGFLAIGIDEFGNFLNPGDNTATGPGQFANRIAVRGPGNVNWWYLNNAYPSLFPSSWAGAAVTVSGVSCSPRSSCTKSGLAVRNTCRNGYLTDYNNNAFTVDGNKITIPDYNAVTSATKVLDKTLQPIATENVTTRGAAVPITYRLKITQDGILSLAYSYNGSAFSNVLSPQAISTLVGSSLPSTIRFGFAGSTGGSTNVHEIACFQASPPKSADTSVGVNQKEAAKIANGTQAFLAFYSPDTWTGDVTANNLLISNGLVTVSATANWDASCVLNGVAGGKNCLMTGASGPITAQAPSSRVMMTWNGTQGIPFEYNSLTSSQQSAIDSGDATQTANRVNYLRGDRSNEINTSGVGLYRARTGILGDVVNSSPTWVGFPESPYAIVWKDRLYSTTTAPENGTATYAQYVSAQQTRLNIVYAGANDGFVHGFRAGSYDANHNFVSNTTTPNDGKEMLAYMPAAVLKTIHNSTDPTQDFSNTQYAHSFYVDATPDQDDLFYQGAWHTWLVGGLGAGGAAIYALDVTNPGNFSESNAASLVIGEWTPSTITCPNTSSCGNNLGNTYGTPVIRRLHNGMWGVIFGNGYGSSTGDAGLFIMTINPTDGTKTFYYFSAGQAGKADGMAYPSPADLDGDDIIDYVYAGDINGNVWRFDLTSNDPTQWAVSAGPLFTDPNGHPVSSKVLVGATLVSQGTPRILIDFGTGRKIPLTATTPDTYASGAQTLYGVWDWNMASWNAMSSVHFASLASSPGNISQSSLVKQSLTPSSQTGVLDDTSLAVCWADDTADCSATPQYGWYIVLPGSGEQVIFNPLLYQGTIYVNTTIPPDNSPLNCNPSTETGNTIAVSATTGGVVKGLFPDYSDAQVAGEATDPSGSPFIVLANGGAYVLTQSTLGLNNETAPANGPLACTTNSTMVCEAQVAYHGISGKRLTWIETR